MASRRQTPKEEPESRRPPSKTLDGREKQMVALAVDLAEKQMRDGTATSQVISHYLKLGSSRERLEQERLEHENELLQAKTEQIANQAQMIERYDNALKAMRSYSGQDYEVSDEG